jgi:hypothetical protein
MSRFGGLSGLKGEGLGLYAFNEEYIMLERKGVASESC